jgi:predicted short-subunit dehydrogenase-like oxidoreductase (DUF2520 family)
MTRYNISFAGAGRVAGALCRELYSAGHKIDLIVSESAERGPSLATECGAGWSDKLKYSGKTDVIIVAVPDHRLELVIGEIECDIKTLIVHTAGSYGTEVFPDSIKRRGVFYPLQTFSPDRKVDFRELPILIESTGKDSSEILSGLAISLGARIFETDQEKRRQLHLAAVFANNFSNHMLTSAKEIVSMAGFSFDILIPLITETFRKAIANGPENVQTGPAARNDINTIEKHLDLLTSSSRLNRLYSEITQSIINSYKT